MFSSSHNLYYVKPKPQKEPTDGAQEKLFRHNQSPQKNEETNVIAQLHLHPTYAKHRDAIDLIRWTLAVARISADSPRFAQYVSRWVVPEKIALAKAEGWFDEAVADCPPFDPSWIRFVPAALEEYERFKALYPRKPLRTPEIKAKKSTKTPAKAATESASTLARKRKSAK
ncbi:MAG: hypothetical protein L6Q55_01025 [Azonexus sp.]|nr:hypothetical protein [Azonexus sp.]MCK6410991.1 hypothetical protein [Azonexus sp.]